MKQTILGIICVILLNSGSVFAERVVGEHRGVEISIVDRISSDGHDHGDEFYALNKNDFAVTVWIVVTEAKNVSTKLIEEPTLLEPGQRLYLGYVYQYDWYSDSEHFYKIQVVPKY
jgi:hypothetical protein